MVTDQIADMLTRIRNAGRVKHPVVSIPSSKTKSSIAKVLQDEGYIESFEQAEDANSKPVIKVFLKYDNYGESVIREIKRMSKPGRRTYVGKGGIPYSKGGLGVVIVSTSKGMLSDKQARAEGIGGELVCSVF